MRYSLCADVAPARFDALRHRGAEPRWSRGFISMMFDSAGTASAWAGLPGARRRYPVADGGDGADAVGRSTWPQHLEVPVPELTRRR
jgi:hypothetical protein